MPRQNTIVLVYRDEIEQFAMLMNQGLPLDTLIHLTFKKDEEIITYLKEGMNLQEIFTLNQKKLYFKYLRILSGKLNLSDALDCVNKIEKSSNTFFETLLKKNVTEYALIYKQGISANTIHRIKKGLPITTKTIDTLCFILDCEVQDIIEHDKNE